MTRPEGDSLPVGDLASEKRRLARDRAARARFADRIVPGLPVDADAPALRVATPRVGSLLDGLLAQLTDVREPFFDVVCDSWPRICPADFPARPGRLREGHLVFYVRSAAQVFSLRAKLPKVRRLVLALPGAPKRLALHLEVHGDRAAVRGL